MDAAALGSAQLRASSSSRRPLARGRCAPTECGTERGFVRHGQSGRQLSYAELTAHLERRPREPVHLKDPSRFFLIGTPARRLDSAQKASGRAIFGIDVRMPGQLTAVVARPSALGATLRSFDRGPALAVPGVKNVVRLHSGVAVVAGNFWAARSRAVVALPHSGQLQRRGSTPHG